MSFELIIFYFFSAIMVVAALRMITAKNTVHSILSLVLVFFTSSAIWLLLEAEFLAITLVLVYVGAVMVLFLFVVMMLNINTAKIREGFVKFMPVAIVVALVMIAELVLIVISKEFRIERASHSAQELGNTHELGKILYTDYLLPFETAAVILLVAIIAAIVLTLRQRPLTQSQNPSEQVKVKAKDRVRIVSLPSENKKEY
ncbi:MAG: NADH-quinone oxidoreductase subunit J [Gammaproteobacteria bacterium]|nr:NADH-quinone oxidoreductase subunit J [Gammaproteobacteria bacterium]